MLEAIRQLNEGRVADAPANIELQDAELTFSSTGNLEATQDAVAACPFRTHLCRHRAGPDGFCLAG